MPYPFPKVSLLVLTYKQRELLDRAVASAFAQECPPIEIVLSDDGSDDGSFERLQALAGAYDGPHRVVVRRNEVNVGIGEHYNRLMTAASGEFLVTAAGDDASTPDRIRRLVDAWDATDRRADLVASHVRDLDHEGRLHEVIRVDDLSQWKTFADWLQGRPYIIGASHAFTRRMMDRFGPMSPAIAYEDQIMVFRALSLGGAVTVDAPLVHYMRGGTSAKPQFKSVEEMERWTQRQLDRVLAEMQQLVADADAIGLGIGMHAVMDLPIRRDRFLRGLLKHPTWNERWRLFKEAEPLPFDWRLRKLLHSVFPGTTLFVKSGLRLFHRRYWQARRSGATATSGDRSASS